MILQLRKEALRAEIAQLDEMLRTRKEVDDPIGVFQLSQRVHELRDELEQLGVDVQRTGSIVLFFAGDPVFGSLGIRAEFVGKAIKIFQDIVAKRFSTAERGDLGERGPLPMRVHSDLMITEVARGSFGIVLEEAAQSLSFADTQLKMVLDDVTRTIDVIAKDDFEDFDLFMAEADTRYLSSLGEFFELLDDGRATLRIVKGDADRTLSVEEVHRARERIAAVVIREEENSQAMGRLFILPEHRKFELRLDSGTSIYGHVSIDFPREVLRQASDSSDVVSQKWRVKIRERIISRPNRLPKKTNVLLGLIEKVD